MPTKYIRHQTRFLVFSDSIQHRELAIKAIGPDKIIHGAGFMRLNLTDKAIEAVCYGESVSLKTTPRRDDHSSILSAIGVENDDEVEHAKYVIWRGKVVVFSNTFEHKAVAEAAFLGSSDCDSAGFIKFIFTAAGKIKVHCYGESMSIGVSAQKNDDKKIAELMEIQESDLHISKQ